MFQQLIKDISGLGFAELFAGTIVVGTIDILILILLRIRAAVRKLRGKVADLGDFGGIDNKGSLKSPSQSELPKKSDKFDNKKPPSPPPAVSGSEVGISLEVEISLDDSAAVEAAYRDMINS